MGPQGEREVQPSQRPGRAQPAGYQPHVTPQVSPLKRAEELPAEPPARLAEWCADETVAGLGHHVQRWSVTQ